MDHFAGLDVSVKETSVCIVDDTGKIVREVKVASEPEALPTTRVRRRISFMIRSSGLLVRIFVRRSTHQITSTGYRNHLANGKIKYPGFSASANDFLLRVTIRLVARHHGVLPK